MLIRWFKKTSQNQSSLLEVGDRFVQSKSVLIIHDTNVDDEGNYVCEATSESGKAITDIYVNVAGMHTAWFLLRQILCKIKTPGLSYENCYI